VKRRRDFLKQALGAAVYLKTGDGLAASSPRDPAESALDEALERLSGTGPEYGPGFANHGPMASEALVRLGRPGAVSPWLDHYRPRLRPHPEARERIGAGWSEALGQPSRVGDWIAFFGERLSEAGWKEVLDTWASRLAPGLVGAATHGLIRTGHAARSLGVRDTPARIRELAEGLGYWAARFEPLPGKPGVPRHRVPSQVIEEVPHLPDEAHTGGLISAALLELEHLPSFGAVVDAVDPDAPLFLSDLTATFARVYLEQVRSGRSLIGFIHSVTGPSAIRLILPHVSPKTGRALLSYGWQAAAGLYAALGKPVGRLELGHPPQDLASLVDRAVATDDEHAIKFTEACLREHALRPDPVYLVAAADAVSRL
jgi:hypothetical protein